MIQKTLLILYIALSLYGAAWISDEFDYARTMLYGMVLIPVFVLYIGSLYYDSDWPGRYPVLYRTLLGGLVVGFLWGNLLLVNAFTGQSKEKVHFLFKEDTTDRSMLAGRSRGGLGWLYRGRW